MKLTLPTLAALAVLILVTLPAPAAPDAAKSFEARKAALAADDVDGLYRLGLWARGESLGAESRACFTAVLRFRPDHRGARKALGYELLGGLWLRGDAAMRAKGFVRRDGQWILAEEIDTKKAEILAEEKRATKSLLALGSEDERVRSLATAALETVSPERLTRPSMIVLERGPEAARLYATEVLRHRESDESLTALIRTSIMDVSPKVRAAATSAVVAAENPDSVYPYLRAMTSAYAPVRMNAAAALGEVRDVRGIEVIIRRLKGIHGGGPRVNIQVGRQISYIRDFDVEIAQAAQIGDPLVGTIQEGVVLDVRVFSVEEEITTVERRLLYRTLARITGEDHGEDVAAWSSWWDKNRSRLETATGDPEKTRRRE